MTKIVWGALESRRYESGVEKGVLYPSGGVGVNWNGITGVAEAYDGGELSTSSLEGLTYLLAVSAKVYKAHLSAFSAPREFGPCVGEVEPVPGFTLTRQPRTPFGFSYRTMINQSDYKIHLVYNCTANPTAKALATTNDTPNPVNLEWDISAVPVEVNGCRPSAHFIVDSTKTTSYGLAALEDILYGTDSTDPSLPTATELYDLVVGTTGP
jgi:hypothetical protein